MFLVTGHVAPIESHVSKAGGATANQSFSHFDVRRHQVDLMGWTAGTDIAFP